MAFVENEETLDNPMGMVIEEEEDELPEDMIAEENPDGSVSFYQEEAPTLLSFLTIPLLGRFRPNFLETLRAT
jgi:hypothetical protein